MLDCQLFQRRHVPLGCENPIPNVWAEHRRLSCLLFWPLRLWTWGDCSIHQKRKTGKKKVRLNFPSIDTQKKTVHPSFGLPQTHLPPRDTASGRGGANPFASVAADNKATKAALNIIVSFVVRLVKDMDNMTALLLLPAIKSV